MEQRYEKAICLRGRTTAKSISRTPETFGGQAILPHSSIWRGSHLAAQQYYFTAFASIYRWGTSNDREAQRENYKTCYALVCGHVSLWLYQSLLLKNASSILCNQHILLPYKCLTNPMLCSDVIMLLLQGWLALWNATSRTINKRRTNEAN